jgi:hypothetical protein
MMTAWRRVRMITDKVELGPGFRGNDGIAKYSR